MGNRIPLWFWLPPVLLVFPVAVPLLSLAVPVLVLAVVSDPLLSVVPVLLLAATQKGLKTGPFCVAAYLIS